MVASILTVAIGVRQDAFVGKTSLQRASTTMRLVIVRSMDQSTILRNRRCSAR